MSFLTGSLLLGLVAAAVPVLIHLLHRQRTVPVPWGAMQFLLESQLQFRRRRKVDHWLLLLARMAMLALLAFLLARPLLKQGALNLLPTEGAVDVAVVIDHSLSAGRKATAEADFGELDRAVQTGGQATVFERGIAVVESLSARMRPNDTLSVVLAEHRPNISFTPLPVRSAGANDVRDKLRKLSPGSTAANVPDAVQAARELLARGPNPRKVILLVTDAQHNAWQIDNAAAWSGALGDRASAAAPKLYCLPVAAESAARNISVVDLTVEPSIVGVNRPAQITATLTNHGPGDVAALGATLLVGGKAVGSPTRVDIPEGGRLMDPATGKPRAGTGEGVTHVLANLPGGRESGKQSVADLKAGSSRTVRFDHVFTEAGSNWVQVKADAGDALPADDAAVAAVNVRQRLPVLVIDGQLTGAGNFRSSAFLLAAMQPVAEESQAAATLIQPKVISAGAADAENMDDYAAVIVNDVPRFSTAAAEALGAYARSGRGVWIILGPRFEAAGIGAQLARTGLFSADVGERKSPATPPGVELKAPQNPMVALLAAAERNAMIGAATKQWWSLSPKDGDEQVVLAAAGGDPLVLERPVGRSGGRVVVWCTSADGAWNNWPLMPNFVPLVNETVHHLAGAGAASSDRRRLEAGMPLEWSAGATPRVKTANLTRPDGKVVPKQPTTTGGRQRISHNDTAEPGLYTLRFEPTEIPQPVYFGVNIDRKELDPATLTEADYAWLKSRGYIEGTIQPEEVASALGGTSSGAELWRWLALGVLGLLVFETVMTRKMIGLQAAPGGASVFAHAGS